jgi:uncharacterized surface protein with fasciclin (FAS1) repeats
MDAAGKPPRVIRQQSDRFQGVHIKAMVTFTSLALVGMLTVAPARAQQTKNIVDTAVAAGSFTTLAKALKAADLVVTLEGPGPFTVFAPTDEAFAKLPAGTLDDLLMPENKDTLRRILTHHVVPGEVRAADVMKLQSAKAASGDTLQTSNGVIHVIDTVILPKGVCASGPQGGDREESHVS